MALVLLNPGLRPLGQFDFKDEDLSRVRGGEIARIATTTFGTEGYAADAADTDMLYFRLNSFSDGRLGGLVDEGQSPSYGTLCGSMVGATAGQGTGLGTLSSRGTVSVGPSTVHAAGKATIWHQAGLYGVINEAFINAAQRAAAVAGGVNTSLYGTVTGSASAGKLTTVSTLNGDEALWWIGREADVSLVSTTNAAAGEAASVDFHIIYFPGPNK